MRATRSSCNGETFGPGGRMLGTGSSEIRVSQVQGQTSFYEDISPVWLGVPPCNIGLSGLQQVDITTVRLLKTLSESVEPTNQSNFSRC